MYHLKKLNKTVVNYILYIILRYVLTSFENCAQSFILTFVHKFKQMNRLTKDQHCVRNH